MDQGGRLYATFDHNPGHYGHDDPGPRATEVSMTDAATYIDGEGLSRRDLLKRGVIGGGLVAAALVSPALTGTAEAHGTSINLKVVADFNTFQTPAADGAGPFYVGGNIYRLEGFTPIGLFHCWGFLSAASAPWNVGVVNQEFDLTGRGKILILGVESNDPRAVIGGTGDFVSARGQGIPVLPDGFAVTEDTFTIKFSLSGASGPSIT
jgi:hypothetical protein